MVVRNNNTPLILWHLARLSADLAGGADLLARLITAKHVGAGVRWIRQNAEHPRMGQPTPDEFAIPYTAVRSTRKEKPTGWCKVHSSSSWSRSLRLTFNRDRLDTVLRGQLMKRSPGWPRQSFSTRHAP